MGFLNSGRGAVAIAVAALVGAYAVAHVVGRSADPEAAAPDPAVTSESAGGGEEQGSASGEEEPARAVEDPTGAQPAEVNQPITGPGRPPLPRSTVGPYGSRPTTGEPYVALTFDDGPDPRWTPEVLALLREYGVMATFCVVGHLAEAHPELIRDIARAGHTLCNHTWDHDIGLGSRSRSEVRDDLERTTTAIQAAAPGTRVSYYRQPGGVWTQRVVDVAEELGMSSLHWAVDPQDWRRPGAGAIRTEVTATTTEGAIVLLHDGGGDRNGTVQALRRILPELVDRFQLEALPPGIDPPRRHGVELPFKPSQL